MLNRSSAIRKGYCGGVGPRKSSVFQLRTELSVLTDFLDDTIE
jgi:hypothetical protein